MFQPERNLSIAVAFVLASILLPAAFADTIDLNTWTAESYPAVAGFGAGVWTVAGGGGSVTQSVNGQPTLFYSDFNVLGSDVRGTIRVNGGGGDDDFIGFALGFAPGDSSNAAAGFLLLDWKAANQDFDFDSPSNTPGGLAPAGLAVSHVTGVPTADEFWQHTDYGSDTGGGLTELARATNLGGTGWTTGTDYEFRFVFQSDRLQVYVDNVLEIDVLGTFTDGRMAFYNFSQSDVDYSAFTLDRLPPSIVPEPASLSLLGLGLVGVALRRFART